MHRVFALSLLPTLLLIESGGMGDNRARRTIDASGLYIVPFEPPEAGTNAKHTAFAPGRPAFFHLSRDPQGRDIVWTLAGDVDPLGSNQRDPLKP